MRQAAVFGPDDPEAIFIVLGGLIILTYLGIASAALLINTRKYVQKKWIAFLSDYTRRNLDRPIIRWSVRVPAAWFVAFAIGGIPALTRALVRILSGD